MCQGEKSVSVAWSISSRAREYSYHLLREGKIHRAELPLPQRIFDAGLEAAFLLFVADLQPEFDQGDPGLTEVLLELGTELQEASVLFLGAKPHHFFDACPVVPTAIQDHDFARRWEMLHIALHVELRLLAVRGGGQRNQAEDAWADALA